MIRRLEAAGIEEPRREAMLLLERFAGVSFAGILSDRGRDYSLPELEAALRERGERRPLQYILGQWDFCGLTFRVTEDCLIPRPDTEIVAERAADLLPPEGRFLDLCTGSGCIAGAVLALSKDRGTSGLAVELVPETARLARENLAALGFSDLCPVLTGDLRDADRLIGEFKPTAKNAPVRQLYDRLGFTLIRETEQGKRYALDLRDYTRQDASLYESVVFEP